LLANGTNFDTDTSWTTRYSHKRARVRRMHARVGVVAHPRALLSSPGRDRLARRNPAPRHPRAAARVAPSRRHALRRRQGHDGSEDRRRFVRASGLGDALMVSSQTEAIGVTAAAFTPLLGALGLFIWNKVWTGDAYTLNLVKCSVGSLGFVFMGLCTRGATWLSGADDVAVFWLIVSSLVGIVIGDNLWLHSLSVLGARRVILIDILKPFIALIFAHLLLFEGIGYATVLGMCITLAGVLTVALEREDDAKEPTDWRGESPGGESPGTVELSDVALDDGAELLPADSPRSGRTTPAAGVTVGVTAGVTSTIDAGAASSALRHSRMRWGYVAAALNVAFDTWGTVLTKSHGVGLNTWEINVVRFGFAALALALGAVFRAYAQPRIHAAMRRRREDEPDFDDVEDGGRRRARGWHGVKPGGSNAFRLPDLTRSQWGQVLVGIMFTTFLAPGLGNFALFKVPSLAVFSTLMCVGPIYALPLGYLIKGEEVSARAVGGSVLAVVGVIPMFFWDHITA